MSSAKNLKPSLPSDSVQKHSSAIHIVGDLGLLERKLINVLLLNAFEDLHIEGHTHTLPIVALLEGVDWASSKNLEAIKEALTRIQRVVIVFDALAKEPKKSKWASMPSLSWAGIEGGILSYRYDKALSNLLAKPDSYAIINVNIQNEFESAYALALYENCYRFYKTGSTGWISVETWRGLLNAQNDMYKAFKYFNQRVLKDAIKAVNAVSNINIEMETERENREVKRVRFKVTLKSQLLLADQAGSSDEELRADPLFASLLEVDIGARLALQWMRDNRQRAQLVVTRVNEMASRGEIKKTKGGLARTLYESDEPIQDVMLQQRIASAIDVTVENAEQEKRIAVVRGAWGKLTDEEKETVIDEFIHRTGAQSRIEGKYEFRDLNEKAAWMGDRAKHAANVIAKRDAI